MLKKTITISIDFDGVICKENWPEVGELLPGAKEVIQKWVKDGHTIIINTLRENEYADMAKEFLLDNDIHYHYFNQNTCDGIRKYYDSRKIAADVYIDDRGLMERVHGVDWRIIDGYMDIYLNDILKWNQ